MDVRFENRLTGNKEMALEFYGKLLYRNRRLYYAILSIANLYLLWSFLRAGNTFWTVSTVVFALYLLFMAMAIPRMAFRRSKKNSLSMNRGKEIEQVVRFGDNIAISADTSSVTLEYSQISRMIRLKHSLILQFGKNQYILLSPDGFTLGNPDDFEAFLRTMCPNLKGGKP